MRTEWEVAVRTWYKEQVSTDEFETKATPEAIRKVAYYLKGCDYSLGQLQGWEYIPTAQDWTGLIITLFDFLAFTGELTEQEMNEFLERA